MAEAFLTTMQQRPGERLLGVRDLEQDPYCRITWTPAAGLFCGWLTREIDRQSSHAWEMTVDASED